MSAAARRPRPKLREAVAPTVGTPSAGLSAIDRTEARALIGAFAVTRFAMLFFVPTFLTDLGHYYELARRFAAGLVPYRDFPFEYPPLALAPIYLPDFVQSIFQRSTFQGYMAAHWGLCFAVDAAIFGLALRRARDGRATSLGLWTYVAGGLLLSQLIYDRYDIVMGGALFLSAAWAAERRDIRSALALAAGAFLKFVPIAFAPFFLLRSFSTWPIRRSRWAWPASFALALATGLAATLWSFGSSVLSFLEFHAQRGIQVESLWASLQWLARGLAPGTFPMPPIEHNYGAAHLARVSSALETAAGAAPLAALAVVFALYVHRSAARTEFLPLGRVLFLASTAMISCGKVLSPQYLIWPLCLVPLASLDRKRPLDVAFGASFAAICAVTAFEFRHYFEIVRLDDDAWAWVLVRNFGLVALSCSFGYDLFFRIDRASAQDARPAPRAV